MSDVDNAIEETGRSRRGPLGRLYHGETAIDFYGRRWLGLGFSAFLILLSVGSLFVRGLNLGIDFEGGVAWEVPSKDLTEDAARAVLVSEGFDGASAKVQELTGDGGRRNLRVQVAADAATSVSTTSTTLTTDTSTTTQPATTVAGATDTVAATSTTAEPATTTTAVTTTTVADETTPPAGADVRTRVQYALAKAGGVKPSEVSTSSVSSTWGTTITDKALRALLVFLVLVALFIAWRLEWRMALAAIAAMLHDVVLSVGVYSLFGFEVTPATVVAFLTILGFSLYDTIVVFDKLKENQQRFAGSRVPYADILNVSMNQVLMRSLNTSIAAVLPVLSLLILGAGVMGAVTLREFALALLVGLITGSYSSIFVASPLVAMLKEREPKFRPLTGRHATGAELERLVHGGMPSARREGVVHRRTETVPVAASMTPDEVLTHTPRPRKKKRRP